jgi:hypothetical protein
MKAFLGNRAKIEFIAIELGSKTSLVTSLTFPSNFFSIKQAIRRNQRREKKSNFHFHLKIFFLFSFFPCFSPSPVRFGMREGHLSDAGFGRPQRRRADWSLCVWGAQRSLRSTLFLLLMPGDAALRQLHNSLQYKLWNVGFQSSYCRPNDPSCLPNSLYYR